MGSLVRLIVGIPGAVIVTGALFLLMAALIKQELRLEEEKAAIKLDITAQIDDTDLNSANRQFKRPTLDAPPPPPPAVNDPSNRPALDGVRAQIPPISISVRVSTLTATPSRWCAFRIRIRNAAWRGRSRRRASPCNSTLRLRARRRTFRWSTPPTLASTVL